jgi:histidinol dehydrogenase
MNTPNLKRVSPEEAMTRRHEPNDQRTMLAAEEILQNVKRLGESAVRRHAERLGDLAPGAPLIIAREELKAALDALPREHRDVLLRTGERIQTFALAQRAALSEIEIDVPGGKAGHTISPVTVAGCYAPGGRFPLPSSVLMTAITARAAGVPTVWVASPRPAQITLAAAAVAGADALVACGGAQAIGAFAYGAGPIPKCDVVVGPGNRWVTAAKKLVAGDVGIDMLAGPSELLIIADGNANPKLVAADLLAQAEHDSDACVILVALDAALIDAVELELSSQLDILSTAETARQALANGCAVAAVDVQEAIRISDAVAPEHLQLHLENAREIAPRLNNYGGLFIGSAAAEVFGDYGFGPNHTLPTGGRARFTGGLSVLHFLRVRTWLRVDDALLASAAMLDAAVLGELEGLHGHARAAILRT